MVRVSFQTVDPSALVHMPQRLLSTHLWPAMFLSWTRLVIGVRWTILRLIL